MMEEMEVMELMEVRTAPSSTAISVA